MGINKILLLLLATSLTFSLAKNELEGSENKEQDRVMLNKGNLSPESLIESLTDYDPEAGDTKDHDQRGGGPEGEGNPDFLATLLSIVGGGGGGPGGGGGGPGGGGGGPGGGGGGPGGGGGGPGGGGGGPGGGRPGGGGGGPGGGGGGGSPGGGGDGGGGGLFGGGLLGGGGGVLGNISAGLSLVQMLLSGISSLLQG